MARHTTVRAKNADADEDKFIGTILEATTWTRRHARLLIAAVVVVVVALAAAVYYRSYRANLEARAATDLVPIRQELASGNPALATKDLGTYVTKYDGTRAGREGRILLAQSYLDQSKPADAVKAVQPIADDVSKPEGTTAAFLLAAAYEGSNDTKNAVATYLRIADNAPYAFQREQALDEAGALRLQHGDAAGAAQLYERLVEMAPDTAAQHSIFEMRLAEAKAEAQRTGH